VSDISVRSFSRMLGVVMMYRKVVRIAVAVVSEPAILGYKESWREYLISDGVLSVRVFEMHSHLKNCFRFCLVSC
jgi:hypothetical protein